jgi:hypothetical protein
MTNTCLSDRYRIKGCSTYEGVPQVTVQLQSIRECCMKRCLVYSTGAEYKGM